MFFLRLGFTNAWRNLARSIFAILSFAFAAGFLTYAVSLSRGYALNTAALFRGQLGGEMVLYNRPIVPDFGQDEQAWEYQMLPFDMMTSIEYFYPEIMRNGYLTSNERTPFTKEYLENLANHEQISAVYPRYQIPVWYDGVWGKQLRYLRGRDAVLDQALTGHPRDYVMAGGRWLTTDDTLSCVVTRFATSDTHITADWPYVGKTITIEVPKISHNGVSYVFDFSEVQQFELSVVGMLNLIIDEFQLPSGESVPLDWQLEEIQIPLSTWQTIWNEVSGGLEFTPEEVALQVPDITYLEDIVLALRPLVSGHSLVSVPRLAEKALVQGHLANADLALQARIINYREQLKRPEISPEAVAQLNDLIAELEMALSTAPLSTDVLPAESPQGLPADLRLPAVMLIFANSALIMAANLLIMVSDRTKEIGILKAVGSRRLEIMSMVWAEATLLALLGCTIGFLTMRFPAVMNQIIVQTASDGDYAGIVVRFTQDAIRVYAITFGAALVFSLLPALRMANLSAMEVLHSE